MNDPTYDEAATGNSRQAGDALEPQELPNDRPSADELAETLNGFDELAIARAFGEHVGAMRKSGDELRFVRALIFVEKRREGAKDAQAYKAAMEIRTVDLGDYFRDDEPDELDEDSEAGKGDGSPE